MLLAVSCAPSHRLRSEHAHVADVPHLHGTEATCLATCVDMVLAYYGYTSNLTQCPALNQPANILAMDSLIHALASPEQQNPYKIQSFVLQEQEPFLDEQLAKKRPLILVFQIKPGLFHSVVLAGVSNDRRTFYIHDPARKDGQWISRKTLLKRWQSSGNTALLIGLGPAGT